MGDLGSIPRLGRSRGEGNDYPLEYSCLENSMDCIGHGVAKSQTRLSDFHFHLFLVLQIMIVSFLLKKGIVNPLQDSCLENPHGQKCLAGYSPWGHTESKTTE